jgi:LCP family protein required for cell wall assembly
VPALRDEACDHLGTIGHRVKPPSNPKLAVTPLPQRQLLRSLVMTKHGRRRRAAKPSGQGRSGSSPNEDGLRALGDLMVGRTEPAPDRPVRSAPGTDGSRDDATGAVANEAGLTALGEEMPSSGSGRSGRRRSATRSRRRRRIRRGALIGLAVLIVVFGAGAGYVYYVTHYLHRVDVRGLNGALTTGHEAGTENILMVGSTSRCALAKQNAAYGLCSQGVNGVNSDVIMILHADPTHHRLALLSVPRDLFIPNARSTGANKVDAGLYEGLTQLVAAIEEDFGIPIQHAVSLNFDQFANVVDALGGINMSFPISVFDASSGLNVQAATCVHLNGTQALQVVRARHLQYDASGTTSRYAENWPQETLSDLARIRRDHEFLRVLATAVAKQGLGDPIADLNLINSVKSDLTFDQTWSVSDMANLVLDFHSVSVAAVPQLTLPVAVVTDPEGTAGSLVYHGVGYGDAEFPAQSQDQGAIDQLLGIDPTIDSMTGNPLPAPSSVAVSVMNGTGAYDQATDTATSLAALGFHTVGAADATPVGDVAETVVDYGSHTPAIEAAAETVARSMTGAVIMAYDPSQVANGAQVTVVTGTQFAVNAPSTPPTGATAGSSTSAAPTTATTAPPATAIAAPSPATSKLQPWDPRACPAGATPTAPVPNPT